MKKTRQIVAVLLLLVISNIILPTVANASDTDTLFDGQYYQIEQKNNTIYILDKETNESASMEIMNDNKAILTVSSGEVVTYTKDDAGNIYENNQLTITAPKITVESKDLTKQARARQYHYFQTTYSNSSVDSSIQSIALGIFSFVPYVGWIGTIAGVVEAFKSLGKPIMYTKTDHYYIDGYSRYKYVTYYYSDAKRIKLVRTTTLYKDMW